MTKFILSAQDAKP